MQTRVFAFAAFENPQRISLLIGDALWGFLCFLMALKSEFAHSLMRTHGAEPRQIAPILENEQVLTLASTITENTARSRPGWIYASSVAHVLEAQTYLGHIPHPE